MAHTPVNHPARPVYRAIGGLVGLYFVVFGVLGIIASAGDEVLAQDDTKVLGQGTNLGFSMLTILLGVAILVGTAIGRNLDVAINQWLAYLLMALGLAELAFLQTDANIFNFSIMIATWVGGMLLGESPRSGVKAIVYMSLGCFVAAAVIAFLSRRTLRSSPTLSLSQEGESREEVHQRTDLPAAR